MNKQLKTKRDYEWGLHVRQRGQDVQTFNLKNDLLVSSFSFQDSDPPLQ